MYDDNDDDGGSIIDILDLPRDEDMDMGGHIELDYMEEDASHTSDDDDNDDDSNNENNDDDSIDGVEQNVTVTASDDDVSIPGVR